MGELRATSSIVPKITKIEEYGLAEACLKLKAQGLGNVRSAKELSLICGEDILPMNVDNFFKIMGNLGTRNRALVARVQQEVQSKRLEVLGNWNLIDGEFKGLLDQAKEVQTRIISSKGEDKELKFKDLHLLNQVLSNIVKVSETRTRVLGQMSGDFHIHITKIENQYNDLKGILERAEETFPGIGEWITNQMLEKKQLGTETLE